MKTVLLSVEKVVFESALQRYTLRGKSKARIKQIQQRNARWSLWIWQQLHIPFLMQTFARTTALHWYCCGVRNSSCTNPNLWLRTNFIKRYFCWYSFKQSLYCTTVFSLLMTWLFFFVSASTRLLPYKFYFMNSLHKHRAVFKINFVKVSTYIWNCFYSVKFITLRK